MGSCPGKMIDWLRVSVRKDGLNRCSIYMCLADKKKQCDRTWLQNKIDDNGKEGIFSKIYYI